MSSTRRTIKRIKLDHRSQSRSPIARSNATNAKEEKTKDKDRYQGNVDNRGSGRNSNRDRGSEKKESTERKHYNKDNRNRGKKLAEYAKKPHIQTYLDVQISKDTYQASQTAPTSSLKKYAKSV